MAGHSKWANIKHRKGKADARKGKIFSRIAKEIISAVRQQGPDPSGNAKLRLAIQKARIANMPSENIERNVKKASSKEQQDYSEMTYELYGYGGVGIIAEVMTDNKNRIASDMRIATNKKGGSIATPGSVAFNFDRKGVIQVPASAGSEEKLFELALDSGAEDFEKADDLYLITTSVEELYAVKEKLEAHKIPCQETSLEMIPKVLVTCDDETRASNEALIAFLEELDDVDSVYHNMEG